MRSTFLILLSIGLLLGGGALDPARGQGPAAGLDDPSLTWRDWWCRNRALLLPEAAVAREPGLESWLKHLTRERDPLLTAIDGGGEGAMSALLRLGACGAPEAGSLLVDALRRPEREAQAAILAMGLTRDPAVLGHLGALLRDRVTGRHLVGETWRAVPPGLRMAAALALGLHGDSRAYGILRRTLGAPDLEDGVAAAVVVGLSFSGSAIDGPRFAACLRREDAGPGLREAAAVAIGRQVGARAAERRLLGRLLRTDPARAGRGAAVGLWFPGGGESEDEARALRDAALDSPDPVTRPLAAIALAGRGDPRAEEALAGLAREPQWQPFTVLGTALLARARPETLERCQRRLGRIAGTIDRDLLTAAWRLLDEAETQTLPRRGRSLDHLSGGNALFSGNAELGGLLTIACGDFRP